MCSVACGCGENESNFCLLNTVHLLRFHDFSVLSENPAYLLTVSRIAEIRIINKDNAVIGERKLFKSWTDRNGDDC